MRRGIKVVVAEEWVESLFALPSSARNTLNDQHKYYGWYANRTRGQRATRAAVVPGVVPGAVPAAAAMPVPIAEPVTLGWRERRLRWAELLRRAFEIGPLACPHGGGAMRIVAFLTQPAVIDQILRHRRARTTTGDVAPGGARSPPARVARTGASAAA